MKMAVKHISDKTMEKVEKELVKAVMETEKAVKESEIISYLIERGIEVVKEGDYKKMKGLLI